MPTCVDNGEEVSGEFAGLVQLSVVGLVEHVVDIHLNAGHLLAGPVEAAKMGRLILGHGVEHVTVWILDPEVSTLVGAQRNDV